MTKIMAIFLNTRRRIIFRTVGFFFFLFLSFFFLSSIWETYPQVTKWHNDEEAEEGDDHIDNKALDEEMLAQFEQWFHRVVNSMRGTALLHRKVCPWLPIAALIRRNLLPSKASCALLYYSHAHVSRPFDRHGQV